MRAANFLIEDPRLLIKLSIVQTFAISNLGHFVKLGFRLFAIYGAVHQAAGLTAFQLRLVPFRWNGKMSIGCEWEIVGELGC